MPCQDRILAMVWLQPQTMDWWVHSTLGDLAATIKHCLLNRFMVNGMRCCQTQLLVRKRAFFHVEDDKRGRQRWHLPGLKFASILLGKISRIRLRHVIDQIDFTNA